MLAYAANRPVPAKSRPSPNAMLAIIVGHVAAIAALMSMKMELPPRFIEPPIKIDLIEEKDPPPPNPADPRTPQRPVDSALTRPDPRVPTPPVASDTTDSTPHPLPGFDTTIGTNTIPQPHFDPVPILPPVKVGPRLATPQSELKPPYPMAKLASEEEAVLRLRLTIDERGRVTAVEPLGRTDAAFLAAARKHILAHWRYKPATEDGRAIGSSTVVTLHFQLDA
jgi:protein TonB